MCHMDPFIEDLGIIAPPNVRTPAGFAYMYCMCLLKPFGMQVCRKSYLPPSSPFPLQVYSCGNGSGVGKGNTEPRQYTPAIIERLDQEIIIDIVTGDGHCLALTQSKWEFAETPSNGMCRNIKHFTEAFSFTLHHSNEYSLYTVCKLSTFKLPCKASLCTYLYCLLIPRYVCRVL